MAKCPECGTDLINGSVFCGYCGARIPDGYFDTVDGQEQPIMMQGQPIGGTGKAPTVIVDGQEYEAYVPENNGSVNSGTNSYGDTSSYSNPGSYSNTNSYSNPGDYSNNSSYSNNTGNNNYSSYNNNVDYNSVYNPNPAPASSNRTNTCCLVGLIMGIVSLVTCGLFCGVLSIVGIIVSVIGIRQADENGEAGKGLGIAGLVLNVIATFGLIMMIVITFLVGIY